MTRKINELAEIVLDRVYKLGYQHRSEIEEGCKVADELLAVERKLGDAERERDKLAAEIETLRQERDHWWQARQDAIEAGELMQAEVETLKGAMDADAKRLRDAEDRVWRGLSYNCNAPEKMADEILHLRNQLANSQRELSEQGLVHGVELQRETADLRQQLDAAQAALTRQRLNAEERGEKLDRLREDHARLGRLVGTRGQELEGQNQELERLRVFVGKVQSVVDGITPATSKLCRICDALAELDAGPSEPTPVTEPLDAEGGA